MKIAKRKTLLKMLENSVISPVHLFKNFYMTDDSGQARDILEDGGLSCAVFVSWMLSPLSLIRSAHATVSATVRDLKESGWQETTELRPGSVILWEQKVGEEDGKMHDHLGFFIEGDQAISNNSRGTGGGERIPHRHHYTYDDTRKIEKIFWHTDLDEEK
jgi:hypothetical protein